MDNTKAFEAQIGVFGTHNFLPPKIITKNAEEIVIGLNKFIIQGSLQCNVCAKFQCQFTCYATKNNGKLKM